MEAQRSNNLGWVDTGHARNKIFIFRYILFFKGEDCSQQSESFVLLKKVCMIRASLRRNVVIILMSVSYCYYRSESCDPTLTRPEQSRPPRHVRINPELPELEQWSTEGEG